MHADGAAPNVLLDTWVQRRPVIMPFHLLEGFCSPWVPSGEWVVLLPNSVRAKDVILVSEHIFLPVKSRCLAFDIGVSTTVQSPGSNLIVLQRGAGTFRSPASIASMICCTSLSSGYAYTICWARTSGSSSSSSDSSSCVGFTASAGVGCGSVGLGAVGCENVGIGAWMMEV